MSKAVRWQVPFASIGGTQYRVDIYDEGYTGDPVTLLAGAEPFVTDEDDDEDFFAPVRSQTGTLQVCTAIPSGGTLNLSDILPDNNIARPVRLIKVGTTETIEWQGFLSCEAYNQDYTAIPENLSLNLISVLETMDSVEVELDESMAFKTIMGHIANAMKAIETKSGMSLFDQLYFSTYFRIALTSTYFYNNVYFEADEQISGDNVTVEVHSISCKAILEQVAQFFGGCWREKGRNIYFEAVGVSATSYPFNFQSFGNIKTGYIDGGSVSTWLTAAGTTGNISGMTWMGNDHQRSVAQGMRRVKVTAKLADFGCDIALEETPVGSLVENPSARQTTWGEVHVNTNETFYNLATHKHRLANVKVELDSSYTYGKKATMNMGSAVSSINYTNTWPWSDDQYRTNYYGLFIDVEGDTLVGTVNHYVTSYMAWLRLTSEEENEQGGHDTTLTSGLMVCALPSSYRISDYQQYLGIVWPSFTESQYIFKQSTGLIFAASRGKFTLDVEWSAFMTQEKMYNTWEKKSGLNEARGVQMAIKWGNKWLQYDGSCSWVNSFTTFMMAEVLKDGKFEGKPHLDIPITAFNAGLVSVYIFPKVQGNTAGVDMRGNVHNLFITKLDLKYEAPEEELRTDRGENAYMQETGQAFKDELSVDVDLASYANNTKLATMIWTDTTTPAKLVQLGSGNYRPEANLLERLKTYYSAARQKLELKVAHPTTALPLLKLNGISDGKTYSPLAESRDWRMEVSTLTCMENPS